MQTFDTHTETNTESVHAWARELFKPGQTLAILDDGERQQIDRALWYYRHSAKIATCCEANGKFEACYLPKSHIRSGEQDTRELALDSLRREMQVAGVAD